MQRKRTRDTSIRYWNILYTEQPIAAVTPQSPHHHRHQHPPFGFMLILLFFWAIQKRGTSVFYKSGLFRVKNGYSLESSKKRSPRATRFAKNNSCPVLKDDDARGTPVNAYVSCLSCLPFSYFSFFFFSPNHLLIVYTTLLIVSMFFASDSAVLLFLWLIFAHSILIFHY